MGFRSGDQVTLKSGSVVMTVAAVEKCTDGEIVAVAWMYNGIGSQWKLPGTCFVYAAGHGKSMDVDSDTLFKPLDSPKLLEA